MRGDVKEKNFTPPPNGWEAVWLASSPLSIAPRAVGSQCHFLSMTKPGVGFVSIWFHVAMVVPRPRLAKQRKQKCWLQRNCQPWSYSRLAAY